MLGSPTRPSLRDRVEWSLSFGLAQLLAWEEVRGASCAARVGASGQSGIKPVRAGTGFCPHNRYTLSRTQTELTVVSLFTGGGGLDLGFEAAGFASRLQTDIDEYSCATLQWGRAAAAREGFDYFTDSVVVRWRPARVGRQTKLLEFRPASGSGEALWSSSAGRRARRSASSGSERDVSDPRAHSGWAVSAGARGLAAMRAFVFENVYGLLSIDGGAVFAEACERLAHPGRAVSLRTISPPP